MKAHILYRRPLFYRRLVMCCALSFGISAMACDDSRGASENNPSPQEAGQDVAFDGPDDASSSADAAPPSADSELPLDADAIEDSESATDSDEPDLAPPPPVLTLSLEQPTMGEVFEDDAPVAVRGLVTVEDGDLEFVVVDLDLDGASRVPVSVDRATGIFQAVIPELLPGDHAITVNARVAPDVRDAVTHTFTITCEQVNTFDAPLDVDQFLSFGPAVRDTRGWIELTQNQINVQGGLFWSGTPVSPGDLDISFSFSTSKCEEPGPCNIDRVRAGGGFAVNFWDVTPARLEQLWRVTGGLGNTTPSRRLEEEGIDRGESFHVLFDTFSNSCEPCGQNAPFDGCGNGHFDPTDVNHVSVVRDGHNVVHGVPDEEGSYCHLGEVGEDFADYWAPIPNLDDGEWHVARIVIEGRGISVFVDGNLVIEVDLPAFNFKGGILSFSAGSGVNGNFHRIDNLNLNGLCQ